MPKDLTGVIAIAAGGAHSLALAIVDNASRKPGSYPLIVLPTNRLPITDETTPQLAASPDSSNLLAYDGGAFTANLASVNRNQPTIVLTHGWIPVGIELLGHVGVAGWPQSKALRASLNRIPSAVVRSVWGDPTDESVGSFLSPSGLGQREGGALSENLGQVSFQHGINRLCLSLLLGIIHAIGHSVQRLWRKLKGWPGRYRVTSRTGWDVRPIQHPDKRETIIACHEPGIGCPR